MSSTLGKLEFWDFLGFYAIQVYGCGLISYPQWSFIAGLKVHASFSSSQVNDQPLKPSLGDLCVYLCHIKYFSCILPFYLFCVFFFFSTLQLQQKCHEIPKSCKCKKGIYLLMSLIYLVCRESMYWVSTMPLFQFAFFIILFLQLCRSVNIVTMNPLDDHLVTFLYFFSTYQQVRCMPDHSNHHFICFWGCCATSKKFLRSFIFNKLVVYFYISAQNSVIITLK